MGRDAKLKDVPRAELERQLVKLRSELVQLQAQAQATSGAIQMIELLLAPKA